MIGASCKPEAGEQSAQSLCVLSLTRKLNERQAFGLNSRWYVRHSRCERWLCAMDIIHQRQKGSIAVFCDGFWLAASELIVKYFKRNRTRISGCHHRACEADYIKVTFSWHVAKVTRAIEQVHVNGWRIGKVNEENFIAGNAADCIWINLACQSVIAVQN